MDSVFETTRGDYLVSTDPGKLQLDVESYWARGPGSGRPF
jgi:hypothetical protein